MRTENIHGFSSILLAFALVLSMTLAITFTAPLVLAPAVISEPGGTTITVLQGQVFTVSFRLEWDQADAGSYYAVGACWDSPRSDSTGTASENFTFVSASATFDTGPYTGQSIAAPLDTLASNLAGAVAPENENIWRHVAIIGNPTGDNRNGEFIVNVRFQAAGAGGVPHVATDNHPITLTDIDVWETTKLTYSPPDPCVTIEVLEWTKGVIVRGKANAYNINGAGIEPFKDYVAGDRPPIVVAQKVDLGAVLAGGIASSSRNWRWNDTGPLNPDPHLDNLLDAAFQWMVPGAENVLWWDLCYNDTSECSQLVAALEALGYTVVGDDRELENMYSGYILPGYTIPGYTIPPGTNYENLTNIDENTVSENNPDRTGYNYNPFKYLYLGSDAYGDENDRIFVKFDLAGLSTTATAISSATLYMETNQNPGAPITVGAYEVDNDDWDGLTITWNNAPWADVGSQLDNVVLDNSHTVYPDFYIWYTWDVTSWVQSEFANDNEVSIMLQSENEDLLVGGRWNGMHYNPSTGPRLEITYIGEETVVDPVVVDPVEYDYGLENMDILVINQLQRDYGDRYEGGDPDKLRATELSIIDSWVRDGGGLVVTEGGDYGAHNYCRVQNRILDTLGVDWWLQHDQIYDDVDNWGALYEIVTDVDTSTPIGMMYEMNTSGSPGKTTVGLYSTVSMVAKPVNTNVSVSVAPAVQNAPGGTLLSYTATINNTGPSNDRFFLTVSDDLGWGPTITSDYLDIASGGSDTATVNVTVDMAAVYCTYDTMTVTATSNLDPSVSDSDNPQAHSLGLPLTLRGVTVDIHPEFQEAELVIDRDAVKKRYDPLTFKVIITNEGELNDKYIITATDGRGWMLELWPTELFLQPGKSDFVVLSVTVPENEIGSTYKDIVVEAFGTMATGTGDDTDNAQGLDTCTVHVKEAYCVRVDVWPFQTQSATPGSKVRWIARVKNLGNTLNIYEITASNIVHDATGEEYAPAVITIDLIDGILELPPCSWEQVIIDLDVPEGLEMSTRIDVLVEVQSLLVEAPDCNDFAEVDVHVVRGIPLIPQGVIKLEVETEIIAIQVWPTYWDFGVLDEAETATSCVFTVRNIGNEPVDVTIAGNDAKSSPGELVTTWMLDDFGTIGLDRYAMQYDPGARILTKAGSVLIGNLVVSEEYNFDLTLTAPSSITVPSRMWTLVNLTAVEA